MFENPGLTTIPYCLMPATPCKVKPLRSSVTLLALMIMTLATLLEMIIGDAVEITGFELLTTATLLTLGVRLKTPETLILTGKLEIDRQLDYIPEE